MTNYSQSCVVRWGALLVCLGVVLHFVESSRVIYFNSGEAENEELPFGARLPKIKETRSAAFYRPDISYPKESDKYEYRPRWNEKYKNFNHFVPPYSNRPRIVQIPNTKLELVTVILRHGHRTPDSLYPTYPNQNETFYPHGFGELTNEGKRREFSIGKALRKRYDKFLGPIVEPNTLVARSSAISRAKRSLLYVLAALYPPKGDQVWDTILDWQAIPTSYLPLAIDNVFFGAWCEEMEGLEAQYKQTQEFKSTFNQYTEVLEYLTNKTGQTVDTYQAVMRLFFDFKGLKDMGYQLPDWSKDIFPRPMQDMSIEMYKSLTANDEMLKYSAGFMMKKILSEMLDVVDGRVPKGRKLYLYSGHEINLAFIMRLLNVYFDHAPPFGAYIVFELHKVNKQYGVKILYEDYTGSDLKVLTVPGCQEICPFIKLATLIRDRLPGPNEACKKTTIKVVAE